MPGGATGVPGAWLIPVAAQIRDVTTRTEAVDELRHEGEAAIGSSRVKSGFIAFTQTFPSRCWMPAGERQTRSGTRRPQMDSRLIQENSPKIQVYAGIVLAYLGQDCRSFWLSGLDSKATGCSRPRDTSDRALSAYPNP